MESKKIMISICSLVSQILDEQQTTEVFNNKINQNMIESENNLV